MSQAVRSETLVTLADHFQQLLNNGELTLPMLPRVTAEVLNLVDDENCNAARLARLIESDQSLAGHVMRLANSAMFSPVGNMNSLQQAITRLGMRNISEIAVAVSVNPKIFKVEGYEELVQALWHTSLATASWARELARQIRRNTESVFLCGLLHQIGKPAVLQVAIELAQQYQIDVRDEVVDQLLSSFEVLVGTDLAQRWKLPEEVIATIASFGGQPIDERYQPVSDIIFAARVLAEYMLNAETMEVENLLGHPALEIIGLDESGLEQVLMSESQIRDSIKALMI